MIVAVLTLTRDRLSYTEHCFEKLRELAGCEFHHYVLDQDSHDETAGWLDNEHENGRIKYLYHAGMNLGIARGMNHLIEKASRYGGYDAFVKMDNDCELIDYGTLDVVSRVAKSANGVVSPIVDGLRNPPLQLGRIHQVGNERVREMHMIGGIFTATPVDFWSAFRYPEDLPKWGGDDSLLCQVAHEMDMLVGYVENLRVNHYETTDGQHDHYPEYFQRRVEEGGPE